MPYQHLTLEEWSMIAPMRILGWSIRSIARPQHHQSRAAPEPRWNRSLQRLLGSSRCAAPSSCRSAVMSDEWWTSNLRTRKATVPLVARTDCPSGAARLSPRHSDADQPSNDLYVAGG